MRSGASASNPATIRPEKVPIIQAACARRLPRRIMTTPTATAIRVYTASR